MFEEMMEKERGNCIFQGDGMTRFEPSDHAKLLDKLDKKDDRRIEYWSKGETNENKVN